MLNKTEKKAYRLLIEKYGYKKEDIQINPTKSPDFVCSDGKSYEAKTIYGKIIRFYPVQLETLKDTDTILVFNKEGLVLSFLWKDREKIDKIVINKTKETTIQIEKSTLKLLKKVKKYKGETYNEVVLRLLKKSK
jgi:hypothetical protein